MKASTAATRMKLHPEQCQNLPFPIGCKVWYDLRSGRGDEGGIVNGSVGAEWSGIELESKSGMAEQSDLPVNKWASHLGLGGGASTNDAAEALSFSDGFVSAVYLDLVASTILYEVTSSANFDKFDDKKTSASECNFFSEKELLYGPGSPVHFTPHDKSDRATCAEESLIPGEILLCRLKNVQDFDDTSNIEATKPLLQIKAALAHENHRIFRLHKPPSDPQHISTVLQLLERLHNITIDYETLIYTKLGATVSKLKSYENQEVARLASSIIEKWHAVKDSDELLKEVLAIKQKLEGLSTNTSSERQHDEIISALRGLNNITVDLKTLEETRISLVVSKLKKHTNTTISLMARDLVQGWKAMASKEEQMARNLTKQPPIHDKMLKDDLSSCVYIVKVLHDDGRFHIEYDVPMDCLKYRHKDNQPTKLALSGPANLIVATTADNHCFKEGLVDISDENVTTDENRCPLASPSTLTESETTPDQSSKQGICKRKSSFFDDQEKRLDQSPKRSCFKKDGHFGRNSLNQNTECGDIIATEPKRLYSSDNGNKKDEEIVSMENDSLHGFAKAKSSPLAKNPTNFVKIPIQIAHISRIIGSNGEIIRDIQTKTGCMIDIRGKGNTRNGYEGSNEPLHARITGDTSGIDAATGMIRAIIDAIDGYSHTASNESEGVSIKTSSPERKSVVEVNTSYMIKDRVDDALHCQRGNSRCETSNGVIGRNKLSSVYCRIHFPPWLVYDDSSKARLHHYLQNNGLNISRIGSNTNCAIEISESRRTGYSSNNYDPTYLFVQSYESGSFFDAKQNIRRAKDDVENILLDHIHNDGSKGRLFYEIAISCNFFHGYINEYSTSVHQRNPFSDFKNRVYMDVVELPYIRNPTTNSKEFIGHFLMCKHTGVLRDVRHKTGCTIIICGDIFNIPVKYCDPYVFVYGEEKTKVDEAVQIVVKTIKERLSTSSDLKWKEDGEHRSNILKMFKR